MTKYIGNLAAIIILIFIEIPMKKNQFCLLFGWNIYSSLFEMSSLLLFNESHKPPTLNIQFSIKNFLNYFPHWEHPTVIYVGKSFIFNRDYVHLYKRSKFFPTNLF
jgi:hypothetical protein